MPLNLGRVPEWDAQNANYPARTLLGPDGQTVIPDQVTHRHYGPDTDQDDVGACEGFSGADALNTQPLKQRSRTYRNADGFTFYARATVLDGFPGEWMFDGDPKPGKVHGHGDDTGTSTLGLCKALVDLGEITVYEWVTGGLDHFLGALALNPLILGIGWPQSAFTPDAKGKIELTGPDVGGHAISAVGYDTRHRLVKIRNHWWVRKRGQLVPWGVKGCAYIDFDQLTAKLADDGDAASIHR